MTHPKDIQITAPEQFALLNVPDFLNQAVTRFLQQFLEAEITSFLQAEPYPSTALSNSKTLIRREGGVVRRLVRS